MNEYKGEAAVYSFFKMFILSQFTLGDINNPTRKTGIYMNNFQHCTAICIHHTNCSVLHPFPGTWFMCHFAAPQLSDFHDVISSRISLSYCVCVSVCVVLSWKLISFQRSELLCFLASLGIITYVPSSLSISCTVADLGYDKLSILLFPIINHFHIISVMMHYCWGVVYTAFVLLK